MLTTDQLNKLATKNQTLPINIYREYCQNLFLSLFYQEKNSQFVHFKGGTALRVYYKSPRYSEDLDFSMFKIRKNDIENLIISVLANLEKSNLKPEIEESKKTSGGYLANLYLNLANSKIKIALQASKRIKTPSTSNLSLIDSEYIPPYTLHLLNESDLITEKIDAALTRSHPRDFFDIYFLLRKGIMTKKQINMSKKTLETIKNNKIDFEKELETFLPKSFHPIASNFEEVYKRELSKYN